MPEPSLNPPDLARDAAFMRRALELAARGWGRTWPNPMVGAVVVQGDEIVAEGWHEEHGHAHAEVNALLAAGERARGATLYVTLEPCVHWGKTPPCTDAIEGAGIVRVVYAAEDPSARAGGGGEHLRRKGLEVVAGVEREAARAQNAAFFKVVEIGTPFVALKYGMSLDARLAAEPGKPTAVTGAAAREEAHRLRAGYDAIVAGIGTVLADDPELTVRGKVKPRVHPARVILDTDGRLPLGSRLLRTLKRAPVWVVCAEDAPVERRASLESVGVRLLPVPRGPGGLALEDVLHALWEKGFKALFVEGGGRLGSALLAEDRIDWLDLFVAPKFLGGEGVAAFPAAPPTGDGAWALVRTARFQDDVLLELRRSRPATAGGGGT